jgi:hypothetical protein
MKAIALLTTLFVVIVKAVDSSERYRQLAAE